MPVTRCRALPFLSMLLPLEPVRQSRPLPSTHTLFPLCLFALWFGRCVVVAALVVDTLGLFTLHT